MLASSRCEAASDIPPLHFELAGTWRWIVNLATVLSVHRHGRGAPLRSDESNRSVAQRVLAAGRRRPRGVRAPRTGAVMFVQRFGGLVNLSVHFHLVVPEGVFVGGGEGLAFALHPVPT